MTTFGTDAFRGMTAKQVAAKYDQVRAFYASVKPDRLEAFDAWVARNNETGLRGAKSRLLSAFCLLETVLTKTTFTAPSEETLRWGGFLGGERYHDSRDAEATCWQLLNS